MNQTDLFPAPEISKPPRQSLTPLVIGLYEGAQFDIEFEQDLKAKGNTIYYLPAINEEDLTCDIILGPKCYNHVGAIDKKTLDLMTQQRRAQMRAERKLAKEHEAETKRKAKGQKQKGLI